MDIQAIFDARSKTWRQERSESQLTLGDLIAALEQMPPETPVNFDAPHSYRGYYCDLAFERSMETVFASQALSVCKSECLGKVFTGYKGGDYVMSKTTPVWIASYGCCGERFMQLKPNGSIETAPDSD